MDALTNKATDNTVTPGRAKNITLWILQALVAIAFAVTGCSKFSCDFQMAGLPTAIAGVIEIILAALMLIPRIAVIGAGLAICIVAGAALAHLTMFHTLPAASVILGASSTVILFGRQSRGTTTA